MGIEFQETDNRTQYRSLIRDQVTRTGSPPPRLLLVDDDGVFCKIMEQVATHEHLTLKVFNSLRGITPRSNWNFDVAIVDYELENITGVQWVHYVESHIGNLPVVLVSGYGRLDRSSWPRSIVDFVHKSAGPYAILMAALRACEHARQVTSEPS